MLNSSMFRDKSCIISYQYSTLSEPLKMKIAIYGPGAIGLYVAYHFIASGYDVTLIAHGNTYATIKKQGIAYTFQQTIQTISPDQFTITDDPVTLPKQDLVISTLKSQVLLDQYQKITSLMSDKTLLLTGMNGIPPWFSLGLPRLESVLTNTTTRDNFFNTIKLTQIIGMVISINVTLLQPGQIRFNAGDGFMLGYPLHNIDEELQSVQAIFSAAHINAALSTNIHREIWLKLMVNIAVNPLSVIYGKSLYDIYHDKHIYQRVLTMSQEMLTLGLFLGILNESDNIDLAKKWENFFSHRTKESFTSMYQDYKNNKTLETDRILDVVVMIADLPKVACDIPEIKSVKNDLSQKLNS